MLPTARPDTEPAAEISLDQVDEALRKQSSDLRFPPAIEERFEEDTAPARQRHLAIFTLLGAAAYSLGPIRDAKMLPDVFGLSLAIKLAIIGGLLIATLILLLRRPGPFPREFLIPVACLVSLIGMLVPAVISDDPLAAHVHYTGVFPVLYGNLILRARFPFAFLSSIMLSAAYIVGINDIAGLPSPAAVSASAVMVLISATTLYANYKLERDERRAYLLQLRGEIRGQHLATANAELDRISQIDAITAVANRRAFDQRVRLLWQEALAGERWISILMMDVDWFKGFNDLYGHQAGDTCLREVAQVVRGELRGGSDLIARYGGEEFAIVLLGADLHDGLRIADRIRQAVEERAIKHDAAPEKVVTISIGVASSIASSELTLSELIESADAALYGAKHNGRNRVWPPARTGLFAATGRLHARGG